MSEECTHDCSSCGSNCAERVEEQKNKDNYAGVKKVIAVVSGKGGVGKSMVTSLLAVNSEKNGLKTAIMEQVHQFLSHSDLKRRQSVMKKEQLFILKLRRAESR